MHYHLNTKLIGEPRLVWKIEAIYEAEYEDGYVSENGLFMHDNLTARQAVDYIKNEQAAFDETVHNNMSISTGGKR